VGLSDDYHQPPDLYAPDPAGDECPECGAAVGDEVYCESCDAVLDHEEAAAIEREAAEDMAYDLHREMEREGR
jgi:hypothetical protein